MADWTGDGRSTADVYREMAQISFVTSSPVYARLALAVADDAALLAALERELPPIKRQPNLVFGALRLLGGPVDPAAAALAWLHEHLDDVVAVARTHRTQTNEASRCATLLPLLATLPGPLALLEVGASAGLCLLPDRYAYRYETATGPHDVGRSPLQLRCAVTGPAPLPERVPEVVWRAGLDLHPLDVRREDDVRWLQALIWPEHTERAANLAAAVELARVDPPPVRTGDLLTDLAPLVHDAPVDATLVVFHSAVLAYLAPADRAVFAASLGGLGREVVWVANEAPGVVVEAARDPRGTDRFVLSRDGEPVAWTGPHGGTLDWLGSDDVVNGG